MRDRLFLVEGEPENEPRSEWAWGMMARFLVDRFRFQRAVVALSVLVAVVAAHFPLPIAAIPAGQKEGAPFPCRNRPCGCQTAEQCWKSCCCFTNAQKVAWAREHGITPPEFVVAAAEKESASNKFSLKSDRKPCCCSKHNSTSTTAKALPRDDDAKVVYGLFARKCRGLGWEYSSLAWIALVTLADSTPIGPVVITIAVVSDRASDVDLEPPVPPPKIASAASSARY